MEFGSFLVTKNYKAKHWDKKPHYTGLRYVSSSTSLGFQLPFCEDTGVERFFK